MLLESFSSSDRMGEWVLFIYAIENYLNCRGTRTSFYDQLLLLSDLWCDRELWRRHRRKVYLTVGVLGSGYLLYRLYDAHIRRRSELERELANERENDELIKAQLRTKFKLSCNAYCCHPRGKFVWVS